METQRCTGCRTWKDKRTQFYVGRRRCKACQARIRLKATCQRCGAPCSHTHCQPCSFLVKPVPERIGLIPGATVRQPARKGRTKYLEPIAIVRSQPVAPCSSWWAEKDFTAAYQRELPRLMALKVSGTPYVNTVLD